MRVFEMRGLGPDTSAIASEAFSRSWQFIERDPVLAGHHRETLQARLALEIQRIMVGNASERDPLRIANRAIGKVREQLRDPERRLREEVSLG